MAAPLLLAAAAVAQGGLSAWRAEENRKMQNETISAKKKLLEKSIQHKREFFELSTFTKYVDSSAAGAKRINQSLMATGGVRNAFAQKHVSDMFLKRDIALGRIGLNKEIEIMNLEISNLDSQHEEYSLGHEMSTFLTSGLQGAVAAKGLIPK